MILRHRTRRHRRTPDRRRHHHRLPTLHHPHLRSRHHHRTQGRRLHRRRLYPRLHPSYLEVFLKTHLLLVVEDLAIRRKYHLNRSIHHSQLHLRLPFHRESVRFLDAGMLQLMFYLKDFDLMT